MLIRALAVAALAVLTVVSLGCPDSDVVRSSNGDLVVEFSGNPAGAGRYDEARLSVNSIRLRPVNPVAQGALGNSPIGVLAFPLSADLNASTASVTDARRLAPGVYELVQINLSDFTLKDSDTPMPPFAACIDQFTVLSDDITRDTQPLAGQTSIALTGFSPAPTVTLPASGQGVLQVQIDVPSFVALVEDNFDCREVGTCPLNSNALAPCLNNFVDPTPDELKALFTFQ